MYEISAFPVVFAFCGSGETTTNGTYGTKMQPEKVAPEVIPPVSPVNKRPPGRGVSEAVDIL